MTWLVLKRKWEDEEVKKEIWQLGYSLLTSPRRHSPSYIMSLCFLLRKWIFEPETSGHSYKWTTRKSLCDLTVYWAKKIKTWTMTDSLKLQISLESIANNNAIENDY